MINAENAFDEEDLVNLMICLAYLSNLFVDNEDDSFKIISVVTSFDWNHVAHTGLLYNGKCTKYNGVSDVVTNERLFRNIQRMIELCGDTKVVGTKIRQQLRKKHPEILYSDSFIRNTVMRIRSDSECAQKLVNTLKKMKQSGKV